jgi:hypothetical protein
VEWRGDENRGGEGMREESRGGQEERGGEGKRNERRRGGEEGGEEKWMRVERWRGGGAEVRRWVEEGGGEERRSRGGRRREEDEGGEVEKRRRGEERRWEEGYFNPRQHLGEMNRALRITNSLHMIHKTQDLGEMKPTLYSLLKRAIKRLHNKLQR